MAPAIMTTTSPSLNKHDASAAEAILSQICCPGGDVNRSKIQEVPVLQCFLTLFEEYRRYQYAHIVASPVDDLLGPLRASLLRRSQPLLIPVDPN
jgi:hypothetical protein